MKKITAILLTLVLIMGIFPMAGSALNGQITVLVNGKDLEASMDAPPIIVNDRTMVPIRAITEALNCYVDWDDIEGTAFIYNYTDILSIKIDSYWIRKSSTVEGYKNRDIALDAPPMIYKDRTLVPLRAIAEGMNAVVDWYAPDQLVTVIMEFDWIYDFTEDKAMVLKDWKWGFINRNREIVVPLVYDDAHYFSDGLAAVKKDGKWGFVNDLGETIIPFIYDDVGPFAEGLAAVQKDWKWGYINTKGEVVIPIVYNQALWFENGKAAVVKDGEPFYIDKNGNRLY